MKLYFEEPKNDKNCLWLKQVDTRLDRVDFTRNGLCYTLMRVTPTFLGAMMCRLPKDKINGLGLCVVALSINLKLTTTLNRAITQNPCYVPLNLER